MSGNFVDKYGYTTSIPVTYSDTDTGYKAVFELIENDKLTLEWVYPTSPGQNITIAPTVTFSGRKEDNYEFVYTNNTLNIVSTVDPTG